VLEKSGSWYSFRGERIGQGRDNARTFLKEHPEMAETIDGEIRKKLNLGGCGDALAAAAGTGLKN
jgi:recombination protein RecA